MLKKLLISVVAVCVLLTTVVSALEIGDDFYLYGRDDNKLATALNMTVDEVKSYCDQNNISVLAVNKDNTKQIREVVCETEFSKTVKNLAVLKNAKGKVIEKNAYKYLKIEVKGKDSGGEYILTQYITVKNGKAVTLSFYTSNGEDTSYTDKIFNSQFSNIQATKGWLTAALALMLGLCVVLSVMIVRDLKPPKREE